MRHDVPQSLLFLENKCHATHATMVFILSKSFCKAQMEVAKNIVLHNGTIGMAVTDLKQAAR